MQNKNQFIGTISEIGGITKKEASSILELMLASIQKACVENEGVKITGIGEVVVKETKASSGEINGVAWSKPAGQTIKAKLSKLFIEKTLEV